MLATGCRPGEARTLRWSEVDLNRKVCVVEGKTTRRTGTVRTIALTPDAIRVLKDTPRECECVFPSGNLRPYTRDGLKAMMRRGGMNSAYALRHTFAQHMLDSGVAIEDVAEVLGHDDNLRTVLRYVKVRSARLLRVAAKLTSPVRLRPKPTRKASSPRRNDA
ncbi:MAG: site-specific integrase [Proteobacteria bacterium]|nr:site-specific integrase [Pseudomonadota bacterium]